MDKSKKDKSTEDSRGKGRQRSGRVIRQDRHYTERCKVKSEVAKRKKTEGI